MSARPTERRRSERGGKASAKPSGFLCLLHGLEAEAKLTWFAQNIPGFSPQNLKSQAHRDIWLTLRRKTDEQRWWLVSEVVLSPSLEGQSSCWYGLYDLHTRMLGRNCTDLSSHPRDLILGKALVWSR